MRTLLRRRLAAVLLAVLAGTAGCAAGPERGPTAGDPATPTDAQVLAIGRALARCVREHGLPDYADPTMTGGRLQVPPVQLPPEAVRACRPIMDRLPATAFGKEPSGPRSAEDMATLRRWARCAREHGLAGWPDPDPDGSFVIRGTPLEHVPQQALDRVVEACEAHSTPGVNVIG
jgi:hypothetical protein